MYTSKLNLFIKKAKAYAFANKQKKEAFASYNF